MRLVGEVGGTLLPFGREGGRLDHMASTDTDTAVGTTVAQHIREKVLQGRRYREARVRLAPSEDLARRVILRRAQLGLTQDEMAGWLGTTVLEVARIERGQDEVDEEMRSWLLEALTTR
jgi:hypothetical protein